MVTPRFLLVILNSWVIQNLADETKDYLWYVYHTKDSLWFRKIPGQARDDNSMYIFGTLNSLSCHSGLAPESSEDSESSSE